MINSLEKKTGPRILVVDDDTNEMRSLVIGLRLEGFDAIGAGAGEQALRLLEEGDFALVIIDLMMPEMNGLQLARSIRRSFANIATMLMSAYHLSPAQLSRADTGVIGFVPKPFSFEDLVRFIRSKIGPNVNAQTTLAQAPIHRSFDQLHVPIEVPVVSRSSSRDPARDPVEAAAPK
ncbi:MAG: response regulator [Myxococcota bacterium]|jgi:DNA-binding response OmpR family regulator|nr:response regulator [Myxococcota bacterium]